MGYLDGKVAIVTGAGRGIGRAEAILLAAEGASVVVNDFGGTLHGAGSDQSPAQGVVDEITAAGGTAVANVGDVADFTEAEGLVDQAIETFGALDILVNNAGIIRTGMSFNIDESDFDIVIRVHVKGTFNTSHFAGRYWRQRAKQSGSVNAAIVNTSSPNGLNGGTPGHVNYAVAKAGIATMTIVLARELQPYGVRCNAIAPVAVTRMTESLWDTDMFEGDQRAEKSPEGVAAVVAYLASPLASHINGQVLGVQGRECTVWENWRPTNRVSSPAGAWTISDLAAATPELFAGRDSGVAPDR